MRIRALLWAKVHHKPNASSNTKAHLKFRFSILMFSITEWDIKLMLKINIFTLKLLVFKMKLF